MYTQKISQGEQIGHIASDIELYLVIVGYPFALK